MSLSAPPFGGIMPIHRYACIGSVIKELIFNDPLDNFANFDVERNKITKKRKVFLKCREKFQISEHRYVCFSQKKVFLG